MRDKMCEGLKFIPSVNGGGNRRQAESHLSLLKDGRGAKEEDDSQGQRS